MASYLVALVLYVLWLWIGIGWLADGEVHDAGGGGSDYHGHNDSNAVECPRHIGNWVGTDVLWGFLFLTALVWMLLVSSFVACCCDPGRDYSYFDIENTDDEHVAGNINNGRIMGSTKNEANRYGAVPSAVAAAVPTPSAPPYDPKIPVATATPIGGKS